MADIPQPGEPDINAGGQFLQISWTLYSIAAVIVALRLYAQGRIIRQLGWGDALVVASLFFGILSCIFLTVAHRLGFGRHFFYLNPSERVNAQRAIYVYEPLSIMGSALGRLSFMVLMYRIFATSKWRRWFILFLMAQTAIINLFTAISIFTQCRNVNTLWDPIGSPSECWSPTIQEYIGFFQSSCNSTTDLVLTFMPAYVFWDLQMGLKTKVGLICLMGLSIFAFIASVIKAVLLGSLAQRGDYTFNTVSFFTWISVENSLVIIAASIPMVRPIFSTSRSKLSPVYEMNVTGNSRGNRYALSSGPSVAGMVTSSEENILRVERERRIARADGPLDENLGIFKCTDHTVTYDIETAGDLPLGIKIVVVAKADWGAHNV